MKTKLLLLIIWMISLQSFAQNTYSTIGVFYLQNQPQTQLNPQDWHYIAVTKSGLNGSVYIDGVLASSSTYANVPYIWNSLLLGATQGCVSCTPVPTYSGLIDEVRISNTARTASEIQNNFNSNSPFTSDANTLGLFHFDSNTGTSITNSAGGNNGVLYGGVSFGSGKFGLGLSFDGVDDYSRITQSIPVNNMTVEFWYKSSDNDGVLAMMEYAYNTGIILNTSSVSCQVPTGTLANGMVAYYPFCGNANDGSVNANNGIVSGATLTSDRYGNANSAYSFDGVNNVITVPNSSSLQNISEITISAWININQFYCVPNFGCNFPIFTKSNQSFSWGNYELQIWQSGDEIVTHLDYQETGCSSQIPLNQWKHIVTTISNGITKFYVDGVLISSGNSGVFPQTPINNMPLLIGRNIQGGYPEAANGKIDDIGIWNRALSQQEVTNLYNNTLNANSFVNTETLITVYPNPAKDHITIDCGNLVNVNGWIIKINNTLGQEIYHSKLTAQVEKISLGSIAKSGLYIINITDRNGKTISAKKVLLQ